VLSDPRQGKNTRHILLAMLRQAVYGRLAGYEDVNDAERLRIDPTMRCVVGGRAEEKPAASTSEMGRFETEMLSSRQNLTALMDLPGTWIDPVQGCAALDKLILDMDSSQSQTYGHREGSANNCYFECPDVRRDYHPLFLFNQRGAAEQWIKEGKYAVKWTRLPCRDFKDNQVRLQLLVLTYNLGNFLRRLALPKAVKHWSLIPVRRDYGRN
jgi:hypothetical protein